MFFFGFSLKNQKKTLVLLVFHWRDTMKTKTNMGFFGFSIKKPKNTMQNQKNQKSSWNQKILSQILVFWFLVSGLLIEASSLCSKPRAWMQTTNDVTSCSSLSL